MQQCALFIIAVEVLNILYCMHFLCCPNSLIPFGSKILIKWRFYFTANNMNIGLGLSLYIKIQFVPLSPLWVSVHTSQVSVRLLYVLSKFPNLFFKSSGGIERKQYKHVISENTILHVDDQIIILGVTAYMYSNMRANTIAAGSCGIAF
jgi:hypothetical protein